MKHIGIILSLVLALGAFSCKKKSSESAGGGAKTAKAAASVEKDLGFKPSVVSINVQSLVKSPLYAMVKPMVEKKIAKEQPCLQGFVPSIKSVVVLLDKMADDKDMKNVKGYIVVKGVDFAKLNTCIASDKDVKVSKAKLNGKEAYLMKDKDEDTYYFQGAKGTVIFVSKALSSKVTPGAGKLGKGEVADFETSKTISFNIGDMDEVKSASGAIDISSGLDAAVTAEVKNTKELDKMMQQYEQAKKNPKALPVPNADEYLKALSVDRKGASVTVKLKLSEKQIKDLMGLAAMFMKK